MTGTIARALLLASGSIELSIVVKATIVLGLGLIGAFLAHRARASVRHVVLATTFGGLLMLPLAVALMPRVVVGVSVAPFSDSMSAPSAGPYNPRIAGSADTLPQTTARERARPAVAAATIIRLIWAAGALLFLVPMAAALWRLRGLHRRGRRWLAGEALVRELALACGVRRPLDTLLHADAMMPMTFGLRRPAILLPTNVAEWREDDVRHALVHELEHVRRGDWLVTVVARVACALYWFHPLAWMGLRLLRLESERACDDAVVRVADRTAYADQLVSMAQRLLTKAPRTALSMANRSDLSIRIGAVLDHRQRRGRASVVCAAVIAMAAVGLVLALAPVEAVGRVTDGHRRFAANYPQTSAQSPVDATPQGFEVALLHEAPAPRALVQPVLTVPTPAAPATQPSLDAGRQTPIPSPSAEAAGCQGLITLLFDTSSMQPPDVEKAVDWAQQWVDERMAPADLVAVATIGSSLQVLTDFTSSKEQVTSGCARSRPSRLTIANRLTRAPRTGIRSIATSACGR
jgi:beta-lactamase regulating signal transducer with metallopeptidase domain